MNYSTLNLVFETVSRPQGTLGQSFDLKKEGIIEKNSYDHNFYESVDDSSLSWIISGISILKEFGP